jgi:hypothetical protein
MTSLNAPPIIAGVTSLAISKWLTFVAAVLLLAPFTAEAISATALADTARVEWQWGVKIPLRDGVHLKRYPLQTRRVEGTATVSLYP